MDKIHGEGYWQSGGYLQEQGSWTERAAALGKLEPFKEAASLGTVNTYLGLPFTLMWFSQLSWTHAAVWQI